METPLAASDSPSFDRSWRLKLIARADRPEPAIKQLIDGLSAAGDLEVHAAYRGRGTVHIEPSPFGDLTGPRPIEYGDAFWFEASSSEGFAEIAHDYQAASSWAERGTPRSRQEWWQP